MRRPSVRTIPTSQMRSPNQGERPEVSRSRNAKRALARSCMRRYYSLSSGRATGPLIRRRPPAELIEADAPAVVFDCAADVWNEVLRQTREREPAQVVAFPRLGVIGLALPGLHLEEEIDAFIALA